MAETQNGTTVTTPASIAASAVSGVVSAAESAALSTVKADVVGEYATIKGYALAESKTRPWVFAAIAFVSGAAVALTGVHYLHLAL